MREGWTYKKLGEACSFINDGDWIESKDQSESGIRLIQTGNIGNGEYKDKGERAKYISEDTFSKLECTEIFKGDCLVSRLPEPIGRCCILPELENRCITAVDCSILRFKTDIIPQLFVYYSQSAKYAIDVENKTTGTTRKRISRKNLEGIQIPIPPKSQQEAIVSELDEINSLLALKREQLQKYDKLAQSLFYEMFGDPVENEKNYPLCHVGDIYKFQYGKGNKIPEDKGEYLCYGSNGIVGHHTTYNSEDSPIIGHIGAYAGIVNWGYGKHYVTYNGVICKLQNNNFDKVYAYYMLKSQDYMHKIRVGVAQPFVSYDMLEAPLVLVPPLSLQQQFASRIEQIESQKQQVQAAIEKLETLLASRMQYWFE